MSVEEEDRISAKNAVIDLLESEVESLENDLALFIQEFAKMDRFNTKLLQNAIAEKMALQHQLALLRADGEGIQYLHRSGQNKPNKESHPISNIQYLLDALQQEMQELLDSNTRITDIARGSVSDAPPTGTDAVSLQIANTSEESKNLEQQKEIFNLSMIAMNINVHRCEEKQIKIKQKQNVDDNRYSESTEMKRTTNKYKYGGTECQSALREKDEEINTLNGDREKSAVQETDWLTRDVADSMGEVKKAALSMIRLVEQQRNTGKQDCIMTANNQ